ncbi:MFS general substrate transporter [Piedraia hortae CBS 480.64]|uniref:MFS general substrate transporter n=1 Tax=Piedraia hortae CBS 480.64 TaxID=1314780 RepID=A0A6A7CA69_9PEZI|nr:MFS general substrate transporter [Piedraia hortae CBS 480.64]
MAQDEFPTKQLFVLGLCRICEPIAFMSIFPYIYYLIESFDITTSHDRIALYAGLVTSAFALAECVAGPFWGRLSDQHGRKPALLSGIAGTGLSMLIFGFSRSLPMAMLARALGGLLNGNIGVLQTTVAELVTVEAHQPRAYATMPFVWCLGSIIGSALGGGLADPVHNYPSLFSRGTIFERYPYLLTNLVCAVVVLCSFTIGFLFLEETHEDKKHERDIGIEIGRWLLGKAHHREETSLLAHSSPSYGTDCGVPPGAFFPLEEPDEALQPLKQEVSVIKAFSPPILLNIVGFGILAYHTISAEQLLPVLFSLPRDSQHPADPVHFTGGFSLPTSTIGAILACQGLIQMFTTLILFPWVTRHLGILATYRLSVFTYPFLYLVVPYLTLLPASLQLPGISLVMIWKVTAQAFAYPSSSIMLANLAPSTRVLGTLNGVAASAASGSRAVGPTLSGCVQAIGLALGVVGLPWWVNSSVAIVGATLATVMRERKSGDRVKEKTRKR